MSESTDIESLRETLQACRADYEALLYAVSHDLRAPLRAVDGFARLLEEDGWTGEAPHHVRVIRENTERMRHMIEGLLEMSRRSRDVVRREAVDMETAARRALEHLRTAGQVGEVEVAIAPLPPCEAHAPFVERLWAVLLDNACKFGATHVRVGSERGDDGETVYFVRDDGSGFDMKRAERLFTPFQRLHGGSIPGIGMGLAIAHLLVARQGGRLWATAAPDEGATFSFTISTG